MPNVFRFALEVDSDRDGTLETGEFGRWDWKWSAEGPGAIALPDLGQRGGELELTPMRLTIDDLPVDGAVVLGINGLAARFATVYLRSGATLQPIAGRVGERVVLLSDALGASVDLMIQPRQFPGLGFDGLIEITAIGVLRVNGKLQQTGAADRAVMRVAPWILTPNTCEPQRVYAVVVPDAAGGANEQFRQELAVACTEAGVPLQLIDTTQLPAGESYDRWIQDEIEFGYAEAPGRVVDVVVDGPRNRGLDEIGMSAQLGTGLGKVLLDADFNVRSSLDSFGNLEVSPPCAVGPAVFPLGRIVFGTKQPSDDNGRKAALRLRQFLYEQRVQTPFELDTDWLYVGHVDEIISFVPGIDEDSFRVLLASPALALELLQGWQRSGNGGAVLWRGQRQSDEGLPGSAEETIDQLLAKQAIVSFNRQCEEKLNGVAADLARYLGVLPAEIVRIPVLFESEGGQAVAYFPDMVNHLVLGGMSIVPRPYGPLIGGVDGFEQAFRQALPDRQVRFIDDWLSYHKQLGEVHCGTNVLRRPLPGVRWWEHRYEGVWDASVR